MEQTEQINTNELATKTSRLLAAITDAIISLIVVVPIMYFMGTFEIIQAGSELPLINMITSAGAGFIFYFAINWTLLKSNAQTIGKKLNNIKVVTIGGDKPPMKDLLLKRYLPYFGFQYLPVVGPIASFVNVCWIFGKDQRCLHDLIANTKVVKG